VAHAAIELHEVSRLPAPGDNTAIATRQLPAGTRLRTADGGELTMDYTILEGHRFAIVPIADGEALNSWGLPFGYALRDIAPGSYLHNARMLDALRLRGLGFPLPESPNFRDTALEAYTLDEARFTPGPPSPHHPSEAMRWFDGYDRGARRGIGTRNHVVILATTSRTSSWARALEERLRGVGEAAGIDPVVAVAHTEGGAERPNNLELLLRTLAGFVVHPNVGAVLVVDHGDEAVTGAILRDFLRTHDYPLDDVPHRFVTLRDSFDADLARGATLIEGWLPEVAATARTRQPLSALKLGLQCGGSDAFSGVSGNPLAAWAAMEVIACGGAANLAETDELIGAEKYVLASVRDLATARKFLATVERFKERVGWHGHTAEGNPSGGNLYRGLYNIAIKSIGAAMKRDPRVRLDHVIEYGEPMRAPGFYFMDSPGNDLESIAGQVAAGSNLMLFITGNGSITNFPFVPTIKIVTTSERFSLLQHDMDVDAGAYLTGTPLEELGAGLVQRILSVAGGARSVGEQAGHAQVSIWRDWPQTGPIDVAAIASAPAPSGIPLLNAAALSARELRASERALTSRTFDAVQTASGVASDAIGLVLPTSLCSGEIARRIAERLNERHAGDTDRFPSRYVALPHTEGCGVSSGVSEELFIRTLVGHLLHPSVSDALLLEHGCEKTHNDYLRAELRRQGVDLERFGWASIQLDGGIDTVVSRAFDWFDARRGAHAASVVPTGLETLNIALAAIGPAPSEVETALAGVARVIVAAGGTVSTPQSAPFLRGDASWQAQFGIATPEASLAYATRGGQPGLHLMETPTVHWVETLTGLAASGAQIALVYSADRPVQAHRMIPVLQISTARPNEGARYRSDFDLLLDGDPRDWTTHILDLLLRAASRQYRPRLMSAGNVAFQITRGRLGVSM
jgi:altronate dehydratase